MQPFELVRNYILAHEEQIVADVISLVLAQSTTARKDLAEHCADVLQALVKERLGADPEQVYPQQEQGRHLFYRIGSGSDGNFTSDIGIPTLNGLGAVGDGTHANHEHILIRESLEHTAMLGTLLLKL